MSTQTSIKVVYGKLPRITAKQTDDQSFVWAQIAPVRAYRAGPTYMIEALRSKPAVSVAPSVVVHAQLTAGQQVYDFQGAPRSVYRIQSKEGQDVLMRARPVTAEGVVITRANVYAIVFMLFDDSQEDQTDPVHQEELAVPEVMLTQLTLDSSWQYDATGYTLQHRIDGDLLVEGGRTYRAEYTLKTDNYGIFAVDAEIETLPRRTPRTYFAS